MSDINLDFTVSNNSIEFTVDPIDLTVTPSATFLNIITSTSGGGTTPGGANTQIQYNLNGNFAGNSNLTFDGTKLTIVGTTSITQALEKVTLISPSAGTYNFYVLDGSIRYLNANATSNVTLNFAGSSTIGLNSVLNTGESVTATYAMPIGSTTYSVTAVQIDGIAQTVKYAGSISPVSNCETVYTFTIIKTNSAPTYKVLGSVTRYF